MNDSAIHDGQDSFDPNDIRAKSTDETYSDPLLF